MKKIKIISAIILFAVIILAAVLESKQNKPKENEFIVERVQEMTVTKATTPEKDANSSFEAGAVVGAVLSGKTSGAIASGFKSLLNSGAQKKKTLYLVTAKAPDGDMVKFISENPPQIGSKIKIK